MSRPLRLEFSGALYHITSRGNGRKNIYFEDSDFELFLETLNDVCDSYRCLVHSLCSTWAYYSKHHIKEIQLRFSSALIFVLFCFNAFAESGHCLSENKRFAFHGDTIIDNQTSLIWKRCSEGMIWNGKKCNGETVIMSLTEAENTAKKIGDEWRVPKGEELYSLLTNPCTGKPTKSILTDIHDLGENLAPYWTSTQAEGIPGFYYYIDFIHGSADAHSNGFSLAVRLVKHK